MGQQLILLPLPQPDFLGPKRSWDGAGMERLEQLLSALCPRLKGRNELEESKSAPGSQHIHSCCSCPSSVPCRHQRFEIIMGCSWKEEAGQVSPGLGLGHCSPLLPFPAPSAALGHKNWDFPGAEPTLSLLPPCLALSELPTDCYTTACSSAN